MGWGYVDFFLEAEGFVVQGLSAPTLQERGTPR